MEPQCLRRADFHLTGGESSAARWQSTCSKRWVTLRNAYRWTKPVRSLSLVLSRNLDLLGRENDIGRGSKLGRQWHVRIRKILADLQLPASGESQF